MQCYADAKAGENSDENVASKRLIQGPHTPVHVRHMLQLVVGNGHHIVERASYSMGSKG